ncbi:O-antigen ligase family protein [Alloiococcus sp. CFN-8]|uniref:O-antigen ligase family protein n=1 Tax=Alloiococcus sp. CFN-8 TaxID=3416081 RepID=UPI003CE87BF3
MNKGNSRIEIKNRRLYFFPVISTILYFIYHTFGITIFMYIGLFAMLVPVLLYPTKDLILMVMFYIPNIRMFLFVNSGQSTVGILLLATFIMLLIKENKKIFINKTLMLGLILFLLNCILTFYLTNSFSLFTSLIRYIIDIILFVYVVSQNDKIYDLYNQIKASFIFGCLVMIATAYAYNAIKGIDVFSTIFSSIGNDRNYYSTTIAFAVSVLIIDLVISNTPKIYNVLIAIVLAIAGAMSLSRTYIIASIVNIVALIFIMIKKSRLTVSKKILLLIGIVLAITIFSDLINNLYVRIALRFEAESMATGNGRLIIWNFYITKTFESVKNALFGLGNFYNLMNEGLINQTHHNVLVETVSTFGLFGATSNILLYIIIYKQIKGNEKIKKYVFSFFPLITLLIGYFSLSAMFSDNFVLCMMFSFLIINVYSKQNRVNVKEYA